VPAPCDFSSTGPAGCRGSLSRNLIVVLCGGAVLFATLSAHGQPMPRRVPSPAMPAYVAKTAIQTVRSLDGPPPGGLTRQERLQTQSGQKLLRHHRAPAGATPVEPARDLTPWGMFWSADIVVKMVMLGSAFASVLT
jgi:biopolymer transport protein ExbB